MTFGDIFRVIIALFIPPLGVFTQVGFTAPFGINLVIYLFGWRIGFPLLGCGAVIRHLGYPHSQCHLEQVHLLMAVEVEPTSDSGLILELLRPDWSLQAVQGSL